MKRDNYHMMRKMKGCRQKFTINHMATGDMGGGTEFEKSEIAEKWFKKSESDEAGCLRTPHAFEYGAFLIEERDDIKRGNH